ncbi:CPBP family intramembrane glutamic endopeptidase [Nocardia sp. IFM 10818]
MTGDDYAVARKARRNQVWANTTRIFAGAMLTVFVALTCYAIVERPLPAIAALIVGVTGWAVLLLAIPGRSSPLQEARDVVQWLGFTWPRPAWPRSRVLAVVVWCLTIPIAAAIGQHRLMLALDVPEIFPYTADQMAANAARYARTVEAGTVGGGVLKPWLSAALAEELIFRSPVLVVQRAFGSRVWTGLAAATSVVVFAWAHAPFGATNVVGSAIGGLLCVTVAVCTRSIWPAIAVHGLYDMLIMWEWVR